MAGEVFLKTFYESSYDSSCDSSYDSFSTILITGLYHPLDGITNIKYKLLYFLAPNKKIQREMH